MPQDTNLEIDISFEKIQAGVNSTLKGLAVLETKAEATGNELVSAFTEGAEAIKDLPIAVLAANKELKNIAGGIGTVAQKVTAIKDIETGLINTQKDLNKQLSEYLRLGKNTDDIAGELLQVEKALRSVKTEQADLNKQTGLIDKVKGKFSELGNNIKDSFVGSLKGVATGFAAFAGIDFLIGQLGNAYQSARRFAIAIKELSSATGITGARLNELEAAAKSLSSQTGIASNEIVNSFKQIGSELPNLIDVKNGLEDVGAAATLLAQAGTADAGMLDLEEATTAVTSALGQFNLEANQSNRIVNALAAGQEAGAASIADTIATLKDAGKTMNDYGLSVEQAISVVQLMTKANLRGAEAGTALRTIFTKLQTSELISAEAQASLRAAGVNLDILTSKTVPVLDKLRELAKAQNDTGAIALTFGEANATAAKVLAQNIDTFQSLTEQVTGTNKAVEQAAKNIDYLALLWNKLQVSGTRAGGAIYETVQLIARAILDYTDRLQGLFKVSGAFFSGTIEGFKGFGKSIATSLQSGNIRGILTTAAKQAGSDYLNAFSESISGQANIKGIQRQEVAILAKIDKAATEKEKAELQKELDGIKAEIIANIIANPKNAQIEIDRLKQQSLELRAKLKDPNLTKEEVADLKQELEKTEIRLSVILDIEANAQNKAAIQAQIAALEAKIALQVIPDPTTKAQLEQLKKDLASIETEPKQLTVNTQKARETLGSLEIQLQKLKDELLNIPVGTAEFKNAQKAIKALEDKIKRLRGEEAKSGKERVDTAKQEADRLYEIERQLQDKKTALGKQALQNRIKYEKDPKEAARLELIAAEAEINAIEKGIKDIMAARELEATLTIAQIEKLTSKEREAKLKALSERVELDEQSVSQLIALRAGVQKDYETKMLQLVLKDIEFEAQLNENKVKALQNDNDIYTNDELQRTLKILNIRKKATEDKLVLQNELTQKEVEAIRTELLLIGNEIAKTEAEIAAERVEAKLKALESDKAITASFIKAQSGFFDEYGKETAAGQEALLSLDIAFLERKRDVLALLLGQNEAYLQSIGKTSDGITTEINEINGQLNQLKGQIAELQAQRPPVITLFGFNIPLVSKDAYKNFTDSQKEAIQAAATEIQNSVGVITQSITDAINSSIEAEINAQEAIIAKAEENIGRLNDLLQIENERAQDGLANRSEVLRKAIEKEQYTKEAAQKKQEQLLRRQAAIEKAAALANIIASQASAIGSLIKMSQGNPANLLTAGIAGQIQFAAGIIQILAGVAQAFAILSKVPSFFVGVDKFDPYKANNPHKDSHGLAGYAKLHANERVVPAKDNLAHYDLYQGIKEKDPKKITHYLLNNKHLIDIPNLMSIFEAGNSLMHIRPNTLLLLGNRGDKSDKSEKLLTEILGATIANKPKDITIVSHNGDMYEVSTTAGGFSKKKKI